MVRYMGWSSFTHISGPAEETGIQVVLDRRRGAHIGHFL